MEFLNIQIFSNLVLKSVNVAVITLILYMHILLMIVHVSVTLLVVFESAEVS